MSPRSSGLPAPGAEIVTPRLRLRRWQPSDLEPFRALNADPRVMEHFPHPLLEGESDALAARIQQHFEERGFGVWAVEIPQVTPFAGYIGLSTPRFEAHFTPCTEIAWRLAAEHWGRGLATEGARAVLDYAFGPLGLTEVVSFTASCNHRSRRVMEKIGMTTDPAEDFDHPVLPAGHRLSRHVLFRIRRHLQP